MTTNLMELFVVLRSMHTVRVSHALKKRLGNLFNRWYDDMLIPKGLLKNTRATTPALVSARVPGRGAGASRAASHRWSLAAPGGG